MTLPSSIPMTVLVVDDQSAVRAALRALLSQMGHQVLEADGAEEALRSFSQHRPDLVLLDVEMPGHDGLWIARALRAAEPDGWTPIIFLSGRRHDIDLWQGIAAGGDDYLVKPASPMVLAAKLRVMERLTLMRRRLVELSESDALTGLRNRRAFDARLAEEIAAARRERSPITLMLCDVDCFKAYNDALGHPAGDRCLTAIAKLLAQAAQRPRDSVARYGGEEFALILPGTPRAGAASFACKLEQAMAQARLPHPRSVVGPRVTLSGGMVSCLPDDTLTPARLVAAADEALYAAKAQGRDRFVSIELAPAPVRRPVEACLL
ncbi:diguanylate cyclase domain-containing protein [Derxia lacustris]|uniref:diguanylate cyclase domain-containing protein n=1 Tax=Derxia lacustris TaxID=764842 RepID=UPI000A1750A0|nr:diguanylate cyclase [Derxia lacustris]